ncbi:MAG: amidohydrolase family protein, partial [Candidatus Vogelbacteria bacterium]|nr:amidohydrolase family protein [Candidatus Vogelbacteria bacterium]
ALADPEVVRASGGIKKIKEILTKTIKRKSDSVLFGSDWPMCDTKKHIALIRSLPITKEEKEAVFYKNALKLFKIE